MEVAWPAVAATEVVASEGVMAASVVAVARLGDHPVAALEACQVELQALVGVVVTAAATAAVAAEGKASHPPHRPPWTS